jgi:hypothetical protein
MCQVRIRGFQFVREYPARVAPGNKRAAHVKARARHAVSRCVGRWQDRTL